MHHRPHSAFARFAQWVAQHTGRPFAFGVALTFFMAWIIAGPALEYHPVWQQLFGVVTGLVTFLMVFLIQNTQNRDTEALHVKLDELLRATKGTRKEILDAEDFDEDDLEAMRAKYEDLAEKVRSRRGKHPRQHHPKSEE